MEAGTPFKAKVCDFRAQLAQNARKTRVVIGLFVLIYLLVGFLVDLVLHGAFSGAQMAQTPSSGAAVYLSSMDVFNTVFLRLVSFKIVPWATVTMGGVAVVALYITYALHDKLMLLGTQYKEITPKTASDLREKQFYNIVEEMKIAAGLRYMPKLYVIDADYLNAFASGYSEKSALIAITRGLMERLSRDELTAVLAHELSHIRHGDIKLTLTASVLSNIMLIVIDILFYSVIFGRDGDRKQNNGLVFVVILLRYLLPLVTVLLMLYLSRTREYMADAGSVELMRDNEPLGKALLKINADYDQAKARSEFVKTPHEDIRRAAYIFDPFQDGAHPMKSFSSMVSTHPSIKDRLKAIGFMLR